ncbi:MAG: hypothetical protein AB8G23_21550 [Myxococcota bacterium]
MSASSWIGVDVSTGRQRPLPKALVPLLVLALLVALGVAALRIDLIRARYAMSAVLAEEEALLEERRKLIVRRRQLRDPVALALHARERGFVQPTQVIALPEPSTRGEAQPLSLATLPGVAAAPPDAPEGDEWQ